MYKKHKMHKMYKKTTYAKVNTRLIKIMKLTWYDLTEFSFKLPKTYGEAGNIDSNSCFNELEREVIRFTIENELSNIQYKR